MNNVSKLQAACEDLLKQPGALKELFVGETIWSEEETFHIQ